MVESTPIEAIVNYMKDCGDRIVIDKSESDPGRLHVMGTSESQRKFLRICGYVAVGAGFLILAGWSFEKFVLGRSDITKDEKTILGRIAEHYRQLPKGGKTSLDEKDSHVRRTTGAIRSLMTRLIAGADREKKD